MLQGSAVGDKTDYSEKVFEHMWPVIYINRLSPKSNQVQISWDINAVQRMWTLIVIWSACSARIDPSVITINIKSLSNWLVRNINIDVQPLYCADFVFISTLSVVLFCVDVHCIFLQTGEGKGVFLCCCCNCCCVRLAFCEVYIVWLALGVIIL